MLRNGGGFVHEFVGWGKSPKRALASALRAEERKLTSVTGLPLSLALETTPYRKVTVEAVGSRTPAQRTVWTYRHDRYVELGIIK